MSIENYEEVDVFPLDPAVQEEILVSQNECSFVWGTQDHWAIGVIMSYVWRDGKFWLTATRQRARIKAIERDERVSVIVSSVGTKLGPAKSITVKGRVRIREDQPTKDWFYPAVAHAIIGGDEKMERRFVQMLDTPRRLVLEVTPEKWITFDAAKMMAASLA